MVINLVVKLEEYGVKILGILFEDLDCVEDCDKFEVVLIKFGIL